MVTAKWALEAGQLESGLETLSSTISRAQELVSNLIRQAGTGAQSVVLDDDGGDRGGEDHGAMHREPM